MRPVTRVVPPPLPPPVPPAPPPPAPPAPYPYDAGTLAMQLQFRANTAVTRLFNNGAAGQITLGNILIRMLHYLQNGNFGVAGAAANATRAARKQFQSRLGDLYRTAYDYLVRNFGEYCSYCETPRAGRRLDIEHRGAKSQYPLYYVRWDNFLLACTHCNVAKLDEPLRAAVAVWPGVPAGANDQQLTNAICNAYLWPDIYQQTYRAVNQRFLTHAPGALVYNDIVAPLNPLDPANFFVANAGMDIRANIQGNIILVYHYVDSATPRMDGLLQLTGLTPAIRRDQRVLLRTRAWLDTLMNYQHMVNVLAPLPDDPARVQHFNNVLWPWFRHIAQRRGYYSVMVRVFQANPQLPGLPPPFSLADFFVADTLAQGIFPGTNPVQIP